MSFSMNGRTLDLIGVVGSGQIGPDIALYFAKVLAPQGCRVCVVDIDEGALERGQARLHKKVDRGQQSGAFSPEWAQQMKDSVTFTTDYQQLAGAQFVVEAATESAAIKAKIFQQLEGLCADDAIIASNSSHLEPEVIGEPLANKKRSLVIHYFFPAERNPIVELVPSAETDPQLTQWLLAFYERIGKVPIAVKSRYGYALDPIFEGIFLAATKCVEEGMGSTKEVDAVATRALGQTVGPFTAMNLTGGNPITAVGLDNYTSKIMPWYATPSLLKEMVESKGSWEVPGRGEKVEVSPEKEKIITEALQGAYLGICDEILTAGLTNIADLEMAVEVALDMTPPAKLANKLGLHHALELTRSYASKHEGFNAPQWLEKLAGPEVEAIDVPVVLREDEQGVAVLTVRRPKSLNSLDDAAFEQIGRFARELAEDEDVRAVVITGFGVKAFVSGADVKHLARIDSPEAGMSGSRAAQAVGLELEKLAFKKPVVCAFNGVAFGGGMEIAMCCTARIAREDLKVLGAQPEVKLGIIPGAGGSQRLPRWIGVEKAAEYLRTGKPFSAQDAKEMGLVQELTSLEDLRGRAIALALEIENGTVHIPQMPREAMREVPAELPAVELGHLSTKVDEILCRAILEGARTSLEKGLELEVSSFGDVCRTQDMRIGLDTFLNEGPRAKAAFKHA